MAASFSDVSSSCEIKLPSNGLSKYTEAKRDDLKVRPPPPPVRPMPRACDGGSSRHTSFQPERYTASPTRRHPEFNHRPESCVTLTRDVWEERVDHDLEGDNGPPLIPRGCGARATAFFLVCVPMLGVIALAMLWLYFNKQALDMAERQCAFIRQEILHIGRLLVNFNTERELTAIFTTARSEFTQHQSRVDLGRSINVCDKSLAAMSSWPVTDDSSGDVMFRSPHLFSAILETHRTSLSKTVYFWDEVQFYTDVMDGMMGWLNRNIGLVTTTQTPLSVISNFLSKPSTVPDSSLPGLLNSYSYLISAISYLGAEQALCSVFHAIICFSHRETFYYTNFSFTGEALFRLYRQSYSGSRLSSRVRPVEAGDANWRNAEHRTFFPELHSCRKEIMADMDYVGMPAEPNMCSPTQKNETRFTELEILTVAELNLLETEVTDKLKELTSGPRHDVMISCALLVTSLIYVLVCHSMNCVYLHLARTRRRRDNKLRQSRYTCRPEAEKLGYHLMLENHIPSEMTKNNHEDNGNHVLNSTFTHNHQIQQNFLTSDFVSVQVASV